MMNYQLVKEDISTQESNIAEILTKPALVSALMIIVSISELILKTEKFYYPVFVAILLVYFIKKKHSRLRFDYTLWIIAFGFYAVFTVLWSPTSSSIVGALNKFVVLMFLGLQLQFTYTYVDYRKIRNAFVIQAILYAILIALFGHVAIDGRLWIQRGDVGVDPNSLVAWTLIPLCLLLETLFEEGTKRINKILALVLVGLLISFIFMCGSRAGIISGLAAALFCVGYGFRKNIRQRPGIALLIILFAIIAGIYIYQHIPASVIARFTNNANASYNTLNLGGRTTKWENLLALSKQSPINFIFGFGEGGTVYYTSKVAHNMYVEIFFNQGIIGLGLVVLYMIGAIRNAVRTNPYIACSLLGVALMSATLSEFASRPVMLAFFLSAALFQKGKGK